MDWERDRVAMNEDPVRTVTAVVLRGPAPEVLVFEQPAAPGLHVPSGRVEANEAPEVAALRTLLDATGVEGQWPRIAGLVNEVHGDEARRRWIYLFDAPDGLAAEWSTNPSNLCRWVPFDDAPVVEAEQPWLETVRASLDGES